MSKFFPKKQMQSDLRMSEADFEQAIQGPLKKGLMEQTVIDGELHYRITELGKMLRQHVSSSPSNRN